LQIIKIFTFIFCAISSLIEGVLQLFNTFGKGEQFSASFARLGTITGWFNKGFSLDGGMRASTLKDSYKNMLVIGQTGSGKSCILTSSIFTLSRGKSSMVVMDVSGTLFNTTSGYLASLGYDIYSINFTAKSDGYNPLDDCNSISDCEKLASTLIANGNVSSKTDQFWSSSSVQGLSMFIIYLALYAPPEFKTMANLVILLDTYAAEPAVIDKLFIASPAYLLKMYKAFNAMSPNTRQSVLVTMRVAIKLYSNEAVAHCTSKTTIPFSSFRKRPSVLYICVPVTELQFLTPFATVVYEKVFKEIMAQIPSKNDLSVFCLVDELILFRFQNLGTIYSNIRKYKGGVMSLIQDTKMMQMNFSEAECYSITSNAYIRAYLQGLDHKTCNELEKEFGSMLIIDKNGHQKTVPLLSSAQIRLSPYMYILAASHPPIQVRLKKFFKHQIFKRYAAVPPVELQEKIPSQFPLLFQDAK